MSQLTRPASRFINVTASDTVPLKYDGDATACRGIAIGTAGDLAIKDDADNSVTIPANALAVGVVHPISTSYILSTGTTASEIVAYF